MDSSSKKEEIWSLHPHVIQNLYITISSVEQKKVHTVEFNGSQCCLVTFEHSLKYLL